jgi:hypothetical protein
MSKSTGTASLGRYEKRVGSVKPPGVDRSYLNIEGSGGQTQFPIRRQNTSIPSSELGSNSRRPLQLISRGNLTWRRECFAEHQ